MTCGLHWGGGLYARPVWSDMTPGGSTLEGGTGAASGVASEVYTLGSGVGAFCCGGTVFVGGVAFGGTNMLKISARCFKSAVYLLNRIVSGIVGVGLRRTFVSYTAV